MTSGGGIFKPFPWEKKQQNTMKNLTTNKTVLLDQK